MTTNGRLCANPCAKGKAGGCTGACAVDFLGADTSVSSAQLSDGKGRSSNIADAKLGACPRGFDAPTASA
jgi:hypothetical protein